MHTQMNIKFHVNKIPAMWIPPVGRSVVALAAPAARVVGSDGNAATEAITLLRGPAQGVRGAVGGMVCSIAGCGGAGEMGGQLLFGNP